ncbi:small nuclear ribonucleoprotein F (RUXF) [Vairimorpha necatrix]|uniref:Sm protein F n=1 Tax=Vairimorpha necatrix TaxID=6039 RepID=A0AAX4JBR7_9MICR
MPDQDLENPKQFLTRLTNKKVRVFFKWGQYYEGLLMEYDKYFNFVLADCKEVDFDNVSELGRVFIRCNNVKMIQEYK